MRGNEGRRRSADRRGAGARQANHHFRRLHERRCFERVHGRASGHRPSACRHASARRQPGDGGTVLLHAARRPRRRRRQDRTARHRRSDAGRDELPPQGRRQPRLHQHEPEQAQRHPRPQDRSRSPGLPQARGNGRCPGRELSARRGEAPRHRLRDPQGDQSRADLRQHLGLRPDGALVAAPGLRPDRPGHGRGDEHHRPSGRAAREIGRAGGRHRLLALRRLRDPERLYRPAADGPRPAHRRLAVRSRARLRGLGHLRISRHRQGPGPDRNGQPHERALPGRAVPGRLVRHGGQQRPAVAQALRGHRPAGPARRPTLCQHRGQARQPGGAHRRPRSDLRGQAVRGLGRDAAGRRHSGRSDLRLRPGARQSARRPSRGADGHRTSCRGHGAVDGLPGEARRHAAAGPPPAAAARPTHAREILSELDLGPEDRDALLGGGAAR